MTTGEIVSHLAYLISFLFINKLRKYLYSIDRMQLRNSSWHFWHLNQISSSNHYMLSYLWQNRSEVRPIISIAGAGTCNWSLTDSLSMYCRTSRVFARKYLRVITPWFWGFIFGRDGMTFSMHYLPWYILTLHNSQVHFYVLIPLVSFISVLMKFWNAGLRYLSSSIRFQLSLIVPFRKQFLIHCV